MKEKNDQSHRKLILILNVKWPDVVTNEKIYENTRKSWKLRRIKWNLEETMTEMVWQYKYNDWRNASNEGNKYALEIYKRPKGRPHSLNASWGEGIEAFANKNFWENLINKLWKKKVCLNFVNFSE